MSAVVRGVLQHLLEVDARERRAEAGDGHGHESREEVLGVDGIVLAAFVARRLLPPLGRAEYDDGHAKAEDGEAHPLLDVVPSIEHDDADDGGGQELALVRDLEHGSREVADGDVEHRVLHEVEQARDEDAEEIEGLLEDVFPDGSLEVSVGELVLERRREHELPHLGDHDDVVDVVQVLVLHPHAGVTRH